MLGEGTNYLFIYLQYILTTFHTITDIFFEP